MQQLIVVGDHTVAWVPADTTVDLSAFPEGAFVTPGDPAALARIGDPPRQGMPDFRPYAAPAKINLKDYAASARYLKETGGITVVGAPVATDTDSQNRIANAYAYIQASKAASVSFKAPTGFVTMSADQVTALALAIGAHVQACFAAEMSVDAGITNGTITTIAQVDAAFAAVTA